MRLTSKCEASPDGGRKNANFKLQFLSVADFHCPQHIIFNPLLLAKCEYANCFEKKLKVESCGRSGE